MPALRVLVVDDNDLVLRTLAGLFRHRNDQCVAAPSAPEAIKAIETQPFDVLLTDMAMPEMDGIELIRRAKIIQPTLVCILMSGVGTRRDIIAALQTGVFDFMDKPIPDIASFNMVIDRAAERSRLIRERNSLLENLKQQNSRLEFSLQRLHEAFGQLRQQEEELESDLSRAQQVQRRFLPAAFPSVPGWDCFAYFGPCDQVGGDFFGTFTLPDGQLVTYLLDVAGHGVSAAIVTVTLRELLRARMRQGENSNLFSNPGAVLAFMNNAVIEEEFEPPVLVTMIYAVFDPASGRVCYAGAGHPAPILAVAGGNARLAPAPGPVLGANPGAAYATTEFTLEKDDALVLYSDGLTETRDASGQEFSQGRLLELVQNQSAGSAASLGQVIETARAKFLESTSPTDDMTFIVLRRIDPATTQPPVAASTSIKFVMPAKLRAVSTDSRGRIKAGWSNQHCIVVFSGIATWQLAPTLREVIRQAREGRAASVKIDLAACDSMDSTMLGLLLQLSADIQLHQPGTRVSQQLQELGVAARFTISHEICPRPEHPMELARVQSREAASEIILSAHEALMEASVDNRMRFQDVVGSMRKEQISTPKPPIS
ncbi:MAG: SpoIIE family protein phosphatase [Nibricoccus sp.]